MKCVESHQNVATVQIVMQNAGPMSTGSKLSQGQANFTPHAACISQRETRQILAVIEIEWTGLRNGLRDQVIVVQPAAAEFLSQCDGSHRRDVATGDLQSFEILAPGRR